MSTRLGAHGAELVLEKKYGRLVVLKGMEVTDISLSESAGKLKYVDPESALVKEARLVGISFGDR